MIFQFALNLQKNERFIELILQSQFNCVFYRANALTADLTITDKPVTKDFNKTVQIENFDSQEIIQECFKKLYGLGFFDDYIEISIDEALKLDGGVDLYLKLNERKYLLLQTQSGVNQKELIKRLQAQGREHLFINKKDYATLESLRITEVLNTKEEELGHLNKAIDNIRDTLVKDSVSKLTVQLARKITVDCLEEIKPHQLDKNTYNLIKKGLHLMNRQMYLLCLSVHMAEKIGWTQEQTLKTLVTASLFHDIYLPEDLQHYSNLEQLYTDGWDSKTINAVKKHTKVGAHFIQNISLKFHAAYSLILHHHEQPDGKGIPHGLKENSFNALTKVFQIAHFMSQVRFQYPDITFPKLVKYTRRYYHGFPDYQKYIDKCFKKK